jgi:hypothetical protein
VKVIELKGIFFNAMPFLILTLYTAQMVKTCLSSNGMEQRFESHKMKIKMIFILKKNLQFNIFVDKGCLKIMLLLITAFFNALALCLRMEE